MPQVFLIYTFDKVLYVEQKAENSNKFYSIFDLKKNTTDDIKSLDP